MANALARIRDLIIILGIYLYFTSWVYIHFYYSQFGISPHDLNIDYSAYLVYSYNVLTSKEFLKWFLPAVFSLAGAGILLLFLHHKQKKKEFYNESKLMNYPSFPLVFYNTVKERFPWLPMGIIMLALFPLLFNVSRNVALKQYENDRINTGNLKTIQFIFRKDVELLSPVIKLDTIDILSQVSKPELSLIKNDVSQYLRLLGESSDRYFVLLQPGYNNTMKMLPQGWVYSISKKDVLISKIILRSH